jgi:Xaa-Pro aminopeptidase
LQIDRSRHAQKLNQGLSFKTIVAFGPNAAKNYYYPPEHPRVSTPISEDNLILVDSGGQYLDGTTSVARTIHLGEPTQEQKKAYTSVLTGLIRLSLLVFPDNIQPAEIDTLIRGPLWQSRHDYQHLSGNGIGSFLSAEECELHMINFQ